MVLEGVSVVQGGRRLLSDVDWSVASGRHSVVLGPNGAGKTTLLRVIAGHRAATTGRVSVLGSELGRVDVKSLRQRIGIVTDGIEDLIHRDAPIRDLVAAAIHGVTHPGHRPLDGESLARADRALAQVGMDRCTERPGSTLSAGEWQRALLARALVVEPRLLLLDEPCAGLDLAQREHFLAHLDDILTGEDAPTTIMVSHHLEEVPRSVTHALLLREGEVTASGPVEESVTAETLSAAFGLPVSVDVVDGRRVARADR